MSTQNGSKLDFDLADCWFTPLNWDIDKNVLLWWPLTICTCVHLWCSVKPEMHGRLHPNYGLVTSLLVHDPLSSLAYPMITHTPMVARPWPTSRVTIVATCYRIARKLGRKLNFVVWWSTFATTKINYNISYLHIILYTYDDPLLNH